MYPAKVESELYFLVVHGSLKVKKKKKLLFCGHTAFGYGCVLVVEWNIILL